jgi:hypothetical protein
LIRFALFQGPRLDDALGRCDPGIEHEVGPRKDRELEPSLQIEKRESA